MERHGPVFLFRALANIAEHLFSNLAQIDWLETEGYMPGLDARNIEQIIDQTAQAFGVRFDDIEEMTPAVQ